MDAVSSRPVVVISEPIGAPGLALLRERCRVLVPWESSGAAPFAAVSALLGEADALVVRLFPVDAAVIASAPRLRVVAKAGVGLDNIDLDAAARRGVAVVSTPGSNSNAVAEHTIALMLALSRRLVAADAATRAGWNPPRETFLGPELRGKTLAIVGLGCVGSRVARIATGGFGMRVRAYDPYVDPAAAGDCAAELVASLDALLEDADFLSLHVPLTGETRRMVDASRLAKLRSTSRLINTSRGAVVDTAALVDALSRGALAGAALDVFEAEPLPHGHALTRAPNVLLSPHVAGMTPEAFDESSRVAARRVLEVLGGP